MGSAKKATENAASKKGKSAKSAGTKNTNKSSSGKKSSSTSSSSSSTKGAGKRTGKLLLKFETRLRNALDAVNAGSNASDAAQHHNINRKTLRR